MVAVEVQSERDTERLANTLEANCSRLTGGLDVGKFEYLEKSKYLEKFECLEKLKMFPRFLTCATRLMNINMSSRLL